MPTPEGYNESFSLFGQTLTLDSAQSAPTPNKERYEWADNGGNYYTDILWGRNLGRTADDTSVQFLIMSNYVDNQSWAFEMTGDPTKTAGWTFRLPGFSAETDSAYAYAGNAPQSEETAPDFSGMFTEPAAVEEPTYRPFTEFDDDADQAALTRSRGFKAEEGFRPGNGFRRMYGFRPENGF